MADDIQQLPIRATAPLLQVTATDTDSRSRGDGFLRDSPGKKQSRKQSATPRAAEQSPAPTNPSVLIQNEANLTHSARTIMGDQLPPLSTRAIPPPEDASTVQPATAPPEHIHFTA